MKTSRKVGLIVVALASVACLVALLWRPDGPDVGGAPDASGGPSFEVRVEKPRLARPLFGILPRTLEEKLEPGGDVRFDHTSRGAETGSVDGDRLELRADGWELVVETEADGKIGQGTRLVYPYVLAERQLTLRCRPADMAKGYLRTSTRPGSDLLDGSFLVECAICENAATGKVIEWPPAPLTVRGRFAGLPSGRR
jgi:hypothetical protein